MTTWNAKTVLIVLGAVLALVGVILIVGAMGPLGEHRDADGYYMSDPAAFDRPSHAIVTEDVDLLRGRYETLGESSVVLAIIGDPNEVRMQGTSSGSNALFMGIAPTTAVDEYLSGVAYDEVTAWEVGRGAVISDVEYTTHGGPATPPNPPGTEGLWVASVEGTGLQTLDWTIESGDWTAVIMNADASAGVAAELAFGAALSSIDTIVATSLTVGFLALILGGLLLYRGLRSPEQYSKPLPADVGNARSTPEARRETAAPRS